MGRLAGKTALVSGGATGMGAATARLFAAEGARVAIIDHNAETGAETADAIRATGAECHAYSADVSDEEQVVEAVGRAQKAFGDFDVLFNHAGSVVVKPFLELTVTDWDGPHAVNVRSMFLVTRAVLPGMIRRGGGAIVCTSSISGVCAAPNEVLYDTTKGACHMFARAIAVEFRDRGIRCNAVCPGFVRTPHGERELAALSSLGADVSDAAISSKQGRVGRPEDIAKAVLFLASDESAFITGTHLYVDNGYIAAL